MKADADEAADARQQRERVSASVIQLDFDARIAGLRASDSYRRADHAADTIAKQDGLRVVLVVLKAGGVMHEHHADAPSPSTFWRAASGSQWSARATSCFQVTYSLSRLACLTRSPPWSRAPSCSPWEDMTPHASEWPGHHAFAIATPKKKASEALLRKNSPSHNVAHTAFPCDRSSTASPRNMSSHSTIISGR